jgi:flagellar secretion chaperone FliS
MKMFPSASAGDFGMNQNAAQEYLKARVMTATPEQLQLMLFDGALRFAEKAKQALEQKKFDQSYYNISKAEKILLELNCSLKHDLAPELCKNLSAIYLFCYRKLVEANTTRSMEALDEAIGILKFQRETWVMLMQQLAKTKAGVAAQKLVMPEPNDRMEQSIRISA